MDFVFCFSMCDYHDRKVAQTNCNPALFPISKSSVLECKSRSSKNLACIGKINALLFAFRFASCPVNCMELSYTSLCILQGDFIGGKKAECPREASRDGAHN